MKAADTPRRGIDAERLLVIDPAAGRFRDAHIAQLPEFLRKGDLLVLNDAATLPSSLRVSSELELRLMSEEGDGSFRALALGAGDHRTPTEDRGHPPHLTVGETLRFSEQLSAHVESIDEEAPQLLRIRFDSQGAEFYQGLYGAARPIQYSYVMQPLELWDVQNRYAARPWAFEMPSAGRPLSFSVLSALRRRGVAWAPLTHAAGISSTGSAALDARLPLPERYHIPRETAHRVRATRDDGGRVVAVGTTVVRALESAARNSGQAVSDDGVAQLKLGVATPLTTNDGILSGMHEAGTSHFSLLEAFAPTKLLLQAMQHAVARGYVQHEFGDACLVLSGSLAA